MAITQIPLWKLPPAERRAEKARRRADRHGATVSPSTPKETPDMSKAEPEVVCGIARTKLDRIIRNIDKARQEKDDGTTAHASAWKDAKEQGAPTEALKLCMKLDRMSEEKRDDFLKAFAALRGSVYQHWGNQPDMFEQATAPQQSDRGEATAVDADADPLTLFGDCGEGEADETAQDDGGEAVEGPGADYSANPENVASDAEYEFVGQWLSDGEQAGLAGVGPEANPHEDGTLAAATWENGRLQGTALAGEDGTYNAGWAAHKAGTERDAGRSADWLKGWDERQKKQDRSAKRGEAAETEHAEASPEATVDGAEILPFVPGAADGAAPQVAAE